MTCIHVGNAIITLAEPAAKLRCRDGRHVWVEDHDYLGPTVYHDRHCERVHEDWPDDGPVAEAVGWFYQRGREQ